MLQMDDSNSTQGHTMQRQANTNRKVAWSIAAVLAMLIVLLVLANCAHNEAIRTPATNPTPAGATPTNPNPPVSLRRNNPSTPDASTTDALARAQQTTHCPFGRPIARKGLHLGLTESVWRKGYDLLHSADHKTPYWVCETDTSLTLEQHVQRKGMRFTADPQLHMAHAEPSDYRGSSRSSIDIGHMAPAGDHEDTQLDLRDTFYLSNAVPQNSTLNRGLWEHIEACARQTTTPNGTTWIITGPTNAASDNNQAAGTTIGAGVVVPSRVWKIVIVKGANGALRVWAVDVPNAQPPPHAATSDFAVSVATIENETGFDLLPNLPTDERQTIELAVHAIVCH